MLKLTYTMVNFSIYCMTTVRTDDVSKYIRLSHVSVHPNITQSLYDVQQRLFVYVISLAYLNASSARHAK